MMMDDAEIYKLDDDGGDDDGGLLWMMIKEYDDG